LEKDSTIKKGPPVIRPSIGRGGEEGSLGEAPLHGSERENRSFSVKGRGYRGDVSRSYRKKNTGWGKRDF